MPFLSLPHPPPPLHRRAFAIAKFDILLDDTALRVTGVTERSQMEPHESQLLSLHQAGTVVHETLVEAGHKHFPSENVKKLEVGD